VVDRQQAFKLFKEGRHVKVRVGGKVYENVLITALNDGSAGVATVTVLLPTPIGEADRLRRWRMDQIEVVA
jgi:hypothetical protein